ncbi:MAG: DUF169 domain-containing protein [Candidatus Hodarchaeota archaeon]
MAKLTIKEIGIKLTQAGKLEVSPLCIYGSEAVPKNSIPINKINRCIASAIFALSIDKNINSAYIGNSSLDRCCPGGQAWLGYKSFLPMLKYFLSTGSEDFRGGAAEFLIANPDLAEERLNSIGKITPLGKYTVIQKCESIDTNNLDGEVILCFGISEQIRNLCSLAYFRPDKGFNIQVPWGPSCASFITYPAGMTKNIPPNSIIIGPTDPTGNCWFPQNYLSIGIPFDIAKRMASDLNDSFISKRSEIAYPVKRKSITKIDKLL